MSARQLNRLAKAKGLDPLLGGGLNVASEESEGPEESSEDEDEHYARGGVVSALAFGDDSDESSSSEEEEQEEVESAGNGGDGERAEAGHFLDDGSDNHVRGGSVVPGIDLSVSETEAPKSSAPPPSAVAPSATSTSGGSVKIAAAAAAKARKIEQENDDEYLDTIISELATAAAAAGAAPHELETGVSSPLARLLRCDVRCLKLDYELRRKFGAGVGGGGDRGDGAAAAAGAARARRARRGMMMALRVGNVTASALALKRLVVSSPKEDWPKPPSLVGGGLGMKRSEAPAYLPRWQLEAHRGADWFMFERSGSLEQLQRRFEAIQGMHDPNLLASFASRAPYHAEALLQLGMVFAHTGQMDRASEFVGRSLYVLESACMEAFRPVDGACRLDASADVNKAYLAAMFRHMQMSGMVGGVRTALEVGRLLLSLDPLGDPMGCLLALGSYALASHQGEFLLELHRSRLPIGFSPARLANGLLSTTDGADDNSRDPGVTVQDLPGLNMSMCLALLDTTHDAVAAREAMASTLLRFPVMLEPLLEKCGVSPRSTSYPHDWRSVMQHAHFGGAASRLPRGHVLLHLASIFAWRGAEIWKHERAQELLYDGAGVALQSLVSTLKGDPHGAVAPADTTVASTAAGPSLSTACPSASETEVLRRAYGKGSPIHKYLDLARADFAESFELLPQDANILDPRLMGPNFMNERVRLRMPAGGGRGQDVLDEVLAMVMQAVGRQAGDMGWDRVGMRRGHRGRLAEGNLSPEAPLAQLLWQTLLPWNVFPTPSNPPPPPPPWL